MRKFRVMKRKQDDQGENDVESEKCFDYRQKSGKGSISDSGDSTEQEFDSEKSDETDEEKCSEEGNKCLLFSNTFKHYPEEFPKLNVEVGNLPIREKDFQTLNPQSLINDEIINAMCYIIRKESMKRGHRIYISSTFYPSKAIQRGYFGNSCLQTATKTKFSSFDIFLFPLHMRTENHCIL